MTLGGILADRLRRRSPAGRLWVVMLAAVLPVPLSVLLLQGDEESRWQRAQATGR